MHSVDVVAADKGDPWAHCAFESLVDAPRARDQIWALESYPPRAGPSFPLLGGLPKMRSQANTMHSYSGSNPYSTNEWFIFWQPTPI